MSMADVMPLRDSKGILWQRGKRTRSSEGELADRLAERHSLKVRFLTGSERVHRQPARKAQWIAWSDAEGERLPDEHHLALRLAPEICREAAEAYGDHTIDSHRSVAGVVALAKCDPRLVVSDWPCHPEIEAAVSGWLDDHCTLDPSAWTARAELLASFVGWERFDADDLSAVLAAHGITYRRKANSHGFDGVLLKDDDGE
jgi:hypothetical protein